jgi:hypothetical protein
VFTNIFEDLKKNALVQSSNVTSSAHEVQFQEVCLILKKEV